MPVKDESKFLHVRLKPKAAAALKRIIKTTRRSLNEEANIAVENHIDLKKALLKQRSYRFGPPDGK